jgi:hypothetical protein
VGTGTGLRTGWEPDTSSADTLGLACLRATADRAADWAEAAGGRVQRSSGTVLADALSPCLFLNVAAVPTVVDLDTARSCAAFFPAGRPFVLVTPHPAVDLGPAGLAPVGHPPLMVRPPGGAVPALPAVLLSSDDGAGVYRRLGYLPVTRWTLWWRP